MPSPPYGVKAPIGGERSALTVNELMLVSVVSPGTRAASPSKEAMLNQVELRAAPKPWFHRSVGLGKATKAVTSPARALAGAPRDTAPTATKIAPRTTL